MLLGKAWALAAASLINTILRVATKGVKRGNIVKSKYFSHKTRHVEAEKRKRVCLAPTMVGG